MSVAIVDYGMGNMGAIVNMLKRIGVKAILTSSADEISSAERLILPGVGAFDTGMRHLHELGLIDVLNHLVLERRVSTLGICLGMQLLTRGSEEGVLPGLGWIDGQTVRFRFDAPNGDLKVPHMGWNLVQPTHYNSLFRGLEEEARFYFVHSYHVVCENDDVVLGRTHYGYDFATALQYENILGAQFHPEKSHRYGMTLLRNFCDAA